MAAPEALVSLSRRLGAPELGLAILAEGNTSTTEGAEEGAFFVKASGRHLGTIDADGFVSVWQKPMLDALKGATPDDAEVKGLLQTSRTNPQEAQMPSVETFMHAYLLSLPGVSYIGHTHPVALLSLLCMPFARRAAKIRLFPDEVVCCGPESCYVPYCDPGVVLALEIKARVETYVETHGEVPKTIWLGSHGLIALGSTPGEVLTASLMSEKVGKVWQGIRGPEEPYTMGPSQIKRIAGRPDEHYRQELLRKLKA